jgi:hypothetical protein
MRVRKKKRLEEEEEKKNTFKRSVGMGESKRVGDGHYSTKDNSAITQ